MTGSTAADRKIVEDAIKEDVKDANTYLEDDVKFIFLEAGKVKWTYKDGSDIEEINGTYTENNNKVSIIFEDGDRLNFIQSGRTLTQTADDVFEDIYDIEYLDIEDLENPDEIEIETAVVELKFVKR